MSLIDYIDAIKTNISVKQFSVLLGLFRPLVEDRKVKQIITSYVEKLTEKITWEQKTCQQKHWHQLFP